MVFELLNGFFTHSQINNTIHVSTNNNPRVVIEQHVKPQAPEFVFSPEPTQTPTPNPAQTPKPTAAPVKTPKPSPAVKGTTTQLTTQNILSALNAYRAKNGAGSLQIDNRLQSYAQSRADYLKSIGKLDKHAGHKEFMANDGFNKLGFNAIAENQGYNYKGDATGLIEKFYGSSSGHNKNQLNGEYTHVGIGINGPFTDIVFGGRKR